MRRSPLPLGTSVARPDPSLARPVAEEDRPRSGRTPYSHIDWLEDLLLAVYRAETEALAAHS